MNQAVESTDAVEFTGLTLTASSLASAGSDNKVLDITQTLNDSSAAGGIQNYATIKANITATNLGVGIILILLNFKIVEQTNFL